ncbi:hypothetical protein [Streptomyces sp. NPDC059639]|uniref:hypothetical protein n=1 Tax=Streptomyces sp. NPDC059639 TaxID=3346891 RepID=UPI00367AF242
MPHFTHSTTITLPLGLWTFQWGQDGVDVPDVLAVVVPTTLPTLMLYGFGK